MLVPDPDRETIAATVAAATAASRAAGFRSVFEFMLEWVRLTHANERSSGLSTAAASGDGALWRRSAVSVGPALTVE